MPRKPGVFYARMHKILYDDGYPCSIYHMRLFPPILNCFWSLLSPVVTGILSSFTANDHQRPVGCFLFAWWYLFPPTTLTETPGNLTPMKPYFSPLKSSAWSQTDERGSDSQKAKNTDALLPLEASGTEHRLGYVPKILHSPDTLISARVNTARSVDEHV